MKRPKPNKKTPQKSTITDKPGIITNSESKEARNPRSKTKKVKDNKKITRRAKEKEKFQGKTIDINLTSCGCFIDEVI